MATTSSIKNKSALAIANEKANAKATKEPKAAKSADVVSRLRKSKRQAEDAAKELEKIYFQTLVRIASGAAEDHDADSLEGICEDRGTTPEQVEKDLESLRRYFSRRELVLSLEARKEVAARRAKLWQERQEVEKRHEAELPQYRIGIAACDNELHVSSMAAVECQKIAKRFPGLFDIPSDGGELPTLKIALD